MSQLEEFGIYVPRAEFGRILHVELEAYAPGWSSDKLLLWPRMAIEFCQRVRDKFQWPNIPDQEILGRMLAYRKSGAAKKRATPEVSS